MTILLLSLRGKFSEEANNLGDKLLRRMVKLHYDWKYDFLRPSIERWW